MEKEKDSSNQDKLGFWLQLYRVYLVLEVGLYFIYLGLVFVTNVLGVVPIEDELDTSDLMAYFPVILLSIYSIKILPKRDSHIPSQLKSCVEWQVILACLLSTTPMLEIQNSIFVYIVSYYYFTKSKKVKEYYGMNAPITSCKEIPLFYPNFRG